MVFQTFPRPVEKTLSDLKAQSLPPLAQVMFDMQENARFQDTT